MYEINILLVIMLLIRRFLVRDIVSHILVISHFQTFQLHNLLLLYYLILLDRYILTYKCLHSPNLRT